MIRVTRSQPHITNTVDNTKTEFTFLFNTYWDSVFRILFRLVGDPYEAEDLAMDVFIQLHQKPPKVMDRDRIRGWFYRVAVNKGLNALRARSRRRKYELEAGSIHYENHAPVNPQTEFDRQEIRDQVRLVLSGMKPRDAKLLVLRHSELSYREIASTLSVSVKSVGTLLARASREFERRFLELEGG